VITRIFLATGPNIKCPESEFFFIWHKRRKESCDLGTSRPIQQPSWYAMVLCKASFLAHLLVKNKIWMWEGSNNFTGRKCSNVTYLMSKFFTKLYKLPKNLLLDGELKERLPKTVDT
jgi:hypothetical protein